MVDGFAICGGLAFNGRCLVHGACNSPGGDQYSIMEAAGWQVPRGLTSCLKAQWLCEELRSDSWGLWLREPPEPQLSTTVGPQAGAQQRSYCPACEEGLQASSQSCPVGHILHRDQPQTCLRETSGRQKGKGKKRVHRHYPFPLPAYSLSLYLSLCLCLSVSLSLNFSHSRWTGVEGRLAAIAIMIITPSYFLSSLNASGSMPSLFFISHFILTTTQYAAAWFYTWASSGSERLCDLFEITPQEGSAEIYPCIYHVAVPVLLTAMPVALQYMCGVLEVATWGRKWLRGQHSKSMHISLSRSLLDFWKLGYNL